ncbi:hypothetical protein ACOSQ2_021018 [Xanthoceras sorbifolium]
MEFKWAEFWVQIHNISLICMTKNIGLHLGSHIGMIKDIDVCASGDCLGKFLRIRVVIDVSKPLKRVLRVKLDGMTEEKTLLLKYERLPKYCFSCGLIGHSYRECTLIEDVHIPKKGEHFTFGVWMRASSPIKARLLTILVVLHHL